jgi:hypothetical protein
MNEAELHAAMSCYRKEMMKEDIKAKRAGGRRRRRPAKSAKIGLIFGRIVSTPKSPAPAASTDASTCYCQYYQSGQDTRNPFVWWR